MNDEDKMILERHGLKRSALTLYDGSPIPDWLMKWASFICQYIDEEESLLPEALCSPKGEGKASKKWSYTPEMAKAEAKGVSANRLQNLAISLDKVIKTRDLTISIDFRTFRTLCFRA